MPKTRSPKNVLELRGTIEKNPGRYAKRGKTPTDPRKIGRCPQDFTPDQRQAWKEVLANDPGVLTRADRLTIEQIARLVAEIRATAEPTASKQALLGNLLHRIGQNPVARNYVQVPEPKKENPFARSGRNRHETPEQREARRVPGTNIVAWYQYCCRLTRRF